MDFLQEYIQMKVIPLPREWPQQDLTLKGYMYVFYFRYLMIFFYILIKILDCGNYLNVKFKPADASIAALTVNEDALLRKLFKGPVHVGHDLI